MLGVFALLSSRYMPRMRTLHVTTGAGSTTRLTDPVLTVESAQNERVFAGPKSNSGGGGGVFERLKVNCKKQKQVKGVHRAVAHVSRAVLEASL